MTVTARKHVRIILAAIALMATGGALSAEPRQSAAIRMQFGDGRVTIVASDVLTADLLAEWSHIGVTEIAGADRVPDRRVTLNISDQDEEETLRLIAGPGFGFAGYVRSTSIPGTSRFARVTLVAAGIAPRAQTRSSSPTGPPEARYSYPMPEKTWLPQPPVSAPAAASVATSGALAPPEPEAVFDYSQPRQASQPVQDGNFWTGVHRTTQPPPGPLLQDPESRFEYSTPVRVLEAQKELQEQPPVRTSTTAPAADPPAQDPEARFLYYTPAGARRPQKSDETGSAGTEPRGVAAPSTTVLPPGDVPAEVGSVEPESTALAGPLEPVASKPVTPARSGKAKASSTGRIKKPATDK
jgi:hypothetical protein